MEERRLAYIGENEKKGKRAARRKRSLGRRRLLFIPIVLLIISFLLHLSLALKLSALAKIEGEGLLNEYLQKTVFEVMKKDEVTYSSLIRLSYKNDGSVAALETDVLHCNLLCADTLSSLLIRIRDSTRLKTEIPLGNLTGLTLLSGKGPSVRAEFVFSGKATAYLSSEFTKSGINQTRHSISLVLSAEALLFLPKGREAFSAEVRVPIAETVLLGKVPDAYTEIHRLTDDITESEIDDIYDFGAG